MKAFASGRARRSARASNSARNLRSHGAPGGRRPTVTDPLNGRARRSARASNAVRNLRPHGAPGGRRPTVTDPLNGRARLSERACEGGTSRLFAFFVMLLFCVTLNSSLHAADLAPTTNAPTVLLIVGAHGEADFGTNFVRQTSLWEKTCQQAGARLLTLGVETQGTNDDLTILRQQLQAEPKEGPTELWMVLIGHGTFDGREARFNLRGPDFSAAEMAGWLKPFRRPLVFINTASASAPFMKAVAATNRVVVTATRSGFEQNFTRFGQFFAEAIADPAGDLDQDGQTSVLEAFLRASHRVDDYYKTEGHLATEHPLIDDNADGQGTPADWFRGTRATRKSKEGAPVDGARARQRHLVQSAEEQALSPEMRTRRDTLELEVESLRDRRATMPADEYFRELEKRMVELARLRLGTAADQHAEPVKPALP